MDLCITMVRDSLGRYAVDSFVVFIDSCAAICLFMWDFLLLDPHKRRVTVNVQLKSLIPNQLR